MENELKDPSRRAFSTRVATCTLGAAIILGLRPKLATAQGKMEQKAVQYQDKPKGSQQCDKCSLFQPPSACKSVEGAVSPQGWCAIFTPKNRGRDVLMTGHRRSF